MLWYQKFSHEKRARNFHKHLEYVGEYGPDNAQCKYPEIWRKYEYIKSTDVSSRSVLATDSDWPFPKTYCKSIGGTIRVFVFFPQNLTDSPRSLIQPSPNLINTESRNIYCSNTIFILSRPTTNWRKYKKLQCSTKIFHKWKLFFVWQK